MKTEDLIGALVADNDMRAKPLGATLGIAALLGVIASGGLFFAVLGPRPDVATALWTSRFALKFVECAALAAAAWVLATATLRPAADRRGGRNGLLAALAIVAAGVVVEALVVPPADWGTRLVGTNWIHCLTLVPLLAAPAFVVLMLAARDGASTAPARTGGALGIAAGAIGAFFYAANCTDDSPLFVATWYSLSIGATGLVGAVVGRRLLAW